MVLNGVKEELASLSSDSTAAEYQANCRNYESVFDLYRRRFEEFLADATSNGAGGDSVTDDFVKVISDHPSLMPAILEWYRKFEMVDNACRDPEQLSIR